MKFFLHFSKFLHHINSINTKGQILSKIVLGDFDTGRWQDSELADELVLMFRGSLVLKENPCTISLLVMVLIFRKPHRDKSLVFLRVFRGEVDLGDRIWSFDVACLCQLEITLLLVNFSLEAQVNIFLNQL